MIEHEKSAAFRRMSRGEASQAEARTIVRHLLAGCSRCQEMANGIRRELEEPSAWDYDSAFDRVQERVARILPPRPARRRAALAGAAR
jgi:hypothetical protein